MVVIDDLKALNATQRAAFLASFLGWTLDAFDFFLLTFILKDIAAEFHADIAKVAQAIVLTLAARPLGALVFGRLADHYGRRPILMIDVGLYSVLALASAFAPTLWIFLGLRFLFGFAMGGEWGIGASLALETIPIKSRGVVSGILQEGYPTGYFLAALANLALPYIHWRGMLMLSVLPALLIIYIHRRVPEWTGEHDGKAWRRDEALREEKLNPSLQGRKRLFLRRLGVSLITRGEVHPGRVGFLLGRLPPGLKKPSKLLLAACALPNRAQVARLQQQVRTVRFCGALPRERHLAHPIERGLCQAGLSLEALVCLLIFVD